MMEPAAPLATGTVSWIVLAVLAVPVMTYLVAAGFRAKRGFRHAPPYRRLPHETMLRAGFAAAWVSLPALYLMLRLVGIPAAQSVFWASAGFVASWYIMLTWVVLAVIRRRRSNSNRTAHSE
jgi:hypothetical protein